MISASQLEILAAAAGPTEFSFDGGADQWRVDVLASVFDGLILLPFALLFVCGIKRLKLNRWLPLTAALATVLAVITSSLMHEFIYPIFMYRNYIIEKIGFHRFEYLLMPGLFVCFMGALALSFLCRRRESIGAFE
jgi:hypothetical protein